MDSWLAEFVCIVEAGSVSAAARELGLPRASLSRRLAALESSYGVQLLHRRTHGQTLTRAGAELYPRARRIVSAMAEARQAVGQLDDVPRGVLRFGLPGWSQMAVMLATVFRRRYPGVEVEIVRSDTHTDLLADRIDVALMSGTLSDPRLIARKLLAYDSVVHGAPSLFEQGHPTLETLSEFDCIVGFDAHGRPETTWPLWNGETIPVSGPIRVDSLEGQIEAAHQGAGLALLPANGAAGHVASGALVPVLTDEVGISVPVHLVWPQADFVDPKVRAFVDLAAALITDMARQRRP